MGTICNSLDYIEVCWTRYKYLAYAMDICWWNSIFPRIRKAYIWRLTALTTKPTPKMKKEVR